MVFPHTYRTEHTQTKTTNSEYGAGAAAARKIKIHVDPPLEKIMRYVDANRVQFLDNLEEAVKIKSIVSELKYKCEVDKMIKFTEKWLLKLHMDYECFNIGHYEVEEKKIRLPPIILASLDSSPRKKTLCAYLHLDVLKPEESNWNTDPWKLHRAETAVYGCGVACGKGPLMSWFHAIEAFQKCHMELPVNLRFIIESMHHGHSLGLHEFVIKQSRDFFPAVDYIVMCDSEWLGEKYPCIIYGTVGMIHINVTIEKTPDSKTEIKDDMENIFKTIVDEDENILIEGFNDFVEHVTPDEESMYEHIRDFDPLDIRDKLPEKKKSWSKMKLLMNFWRFPSIYVDEIRECICDKKDFSKIKRLFILKIVPKQIAVTTESMVKKHIKNAVSNLKIENKVACEVVSSTRPWLEDFRTPLYAAASNAVIQVYKEVPNWIREDRARRTVTIFDTTVESSILVLPLCCKGSNPTEENENLSLRNYYEGTKLLASLMFQLSFIKP